MRKWSIRTKQLISSWQLWPTMSCTTHLLLTARSWLLKTISDILKLKTSKEICWSWVAKVIFSLILKIPKFLASTHKFIIEIAHIGSKTPQEETLVISTLRQVRKFICFPAWWSCSVSSLWSLNRSMLKKPLSRLSVRKKSWNIQSNKEMWTSKFQS